APRAAEGRGRRTGAGPAFGAGHGPLVLPIVGALAGDAYRLGERSFAMPRHGFARRSEFALVEADASSALFRLEASEASRAVYPFDFRLDMAFALTGATLAMTATVSNRGDTPMPFSFGYHPAFAWPLPYGGAAEDHRIVFERDEPAPIRRLDPATGLVAPEPQPSPVEGKVYAPAYADFEADALIWDELASRSLTYGVPGQPRLRIDFPDTPMLGIWQKPGARFLCIEPWAGIADPAVFTGEFADKPGITTLAPGAQQRLRMDVTLLES
ncbi:MAG: aldose 1-epimerase family protein, partial [Blastomonas sp.]|nr:aldose 1-epimerase family protein [Blastomonas sp.]